MNCGIFFSIVCANFSMKTSVYFLLFLYNVENTGLFSIFKLISVYGANELTGDTGDIVSPLYPSSYIPSIGLYVDSSWTITVDSGFKIRIRQIFRFHEKRKKINCKIFLFRFHEFFSFSDFLYLKLKSMDFMVKNAYLQLSFMMVLMNQLRNYFVNVVQVHALKNTTSSCCNF